VLLGPVAQALSMPSWEKIGCEVDDDTKLPYKPTKSLIVIQNIIIAKPKLIQYVYWLYHSTDFVCFGMQKA
jgi:hypothetical protein